MEHVKVDMSDHDNCSKHLLYTELLVECHL